MDWPPLMNFTLTHHRRKRLGTRLEWNEKRIKKNTTLTNSQQLLPTRTAFNGNKLAFE